MMRLHAEYCIGKKDLRDAFRDNNNHDRTKSFEKYLETEFTFCGTSELEKSMQ